MNSSNTLAAETRAVVVAFLIKWTDSNVLTYKFSAHANTSGENRNKVQVVFSKPTPTMPAPAAVAHFCFYLDETLQRVRGFTVESDTHFHALDEIQFDERVIDRVIKHKLLLKSQHLVHLDDEFSSTRIPAAIDARAREIRARERETLEEYLLEMFQRRDSYNDGRLSLVDFRAVLNDLELPSRVGRAQRQILLAFAEQDRNDMIDYASFVPIAADVVDTLAHSSNVTSEHAADAKNGEDAIDNSAEEAEEAYQWLAAREIDYTLQRLNKLLQSHHEQPSDATESGGSTSDLTTAATSAALEADNGNGLRSTSADSDANQHDQEETAEVTGDDDGSVLGSESPRNKASLYVTTRQLRTALESPQLVVSRGETNLVLGLVDALPNGQILLSQLGELYPRVRSLVFQYQCQCVQDELETYMLQQFRSFESSNLSGSAEHVRFKLTLKEVHAVVKDMKKLLLTPYQLMQVLAVGRSSSDHRLDRVVNYKDLVPLFARFLQTQVALDTVVGNAAALRAAQDVTEGASCAEVFTMPTEDTLKRSSLEIFEQFDPRKLGVVSTDDFYASLRAISTAFDMNLDPSREMRQLYVLADANATGRANYLCFVQCLFPLLRFVQQERLVAYGKQRRGNNAQQKESK